MLKVEHPIDYQKEEGVNSQVVKPLKDGQHVGQIKRSFQHNQEQDLQQQLDSGSNLKRFKRSDDNLSLPENFKVGQAIGDGDCFFDSVAKGLKRLKPEMDFTVKSLRGICKRFAQSQLKDDQSWLKEALKNEDEATIDEYVPRIEFTANDIEQKSGPVNVLGLPIWGRSEIEGRIICKEYNVKLHVVEKYVEESKEVWLHQIVNSEGSRSVDSIDYNEENTIHIINRGNVHFEPILSTQETQYRRFDSDEGRAKVEELKTDIDLQNNQGNTDLHEYALLGDLEKFKALFEKLKRSNPNNYLKTVSKYNSEYQTALFLAIENKNFDIALYLLTQLSDTERNHQFDIIDSISSEKIDNFIKYVKDKELPELREIVKLLHKASELKYSRHGGDYQSKLLMLFAYEGHGSDIRFRLGSEVHEADKFDDLVFRYTDSKGHIKYRFLQAKHKQFPGEKNKIKVSDLKSDSDNNDFSLQKYFVSYLRDIQKKEFQDGVPEDFIICTNTGFYFEPSTTKKEKKRTKETWKDYFSEIRDNDKVLNLGGKRYQFSNYPSVRNKIISELKPIFEKSLIKNRLSNDNIKKIGDFLDKLVFAVEQPSSRPLSEKIKEKMGSSTYNFIYFAAFKEYIDEWFASRKPDNTARFILSSEIKWFFDGLKNRIANIELNGLSPLFKKKIRKFTQYKLEFDANNEDVSKVENFLNSDSDRILKLIYEEKDSLLSIAKVYQTLEKKYQDTLQYTISDLQSLSSLNSDSSNQERVVSALKSDKKRLLVIVISECNIDACFIDEDGKELISKLYTVLANSVPADEKKVIFVLNEKANNELDQMLSCLSADALKVKMENNLNSLVSKDIILETEITLFGKERKLTSLTTDASKDDLYSAIDGDALTTLINGDSNIISSEHEYDFDTYIDIPRTLTYQTKIDKKCLNENKNDLFAISSIEKSELFRLVPEGQKICKFKDEEYEEANEEGEPIRFNILDNHPDIKKDFDQLCRDYKKYTIHLLENKDSALEWKQSYGSLFNLRRFVLTEGEQTKEIIDSAIIAGEPGMGKSTILTTYSKKTDSLWPIRINLKDYEMRIHEANFGDLSGIVKFLSNVIDPASSKTLLIKNLLQYCLNQQGQVTLLLDGYDEIKDRNQEKVVQLLRTLKTTQGKVLLTTRSYARSELEDALGIFAYSLNPFEEKEQKEFLKKFWITRLEVKEPTQQKKIDKFTEQLLNHFHKLNLMKEEGLVGIVLQARMVAEIFQDECEDFDPFKFRISNIFDLYERFIEYQYNRYFERIEINEKLGEDSQTSLTRSYTKAYGYLALKSLFSKDQIQGLLRKERFSRKDLQDIGLIKIFKYDGRVDFLHPTYAEYFAADLLVDALGKEKDHPKYRTVHNFLLMQIFRDHNKVIRHFIENKIKKEKDSILSSKWKAIQNCNLLEGVETKVELQLSKLPDDASSEKSLTELLEELKKKTPSGSYYGCPGYFYNNYYEDIEKDRSLIYRVFDSFTKEKNIDKLKPALDYFIEIKYGGGIHLGLVNDILERNFDNIINYYLVEAKKQNKVDHALIKIVLGTKQNLKEIFKRIEKNLNKLKSTPNPNQNEEYLKILYSILEDKKITFEDLPYLSFVFEFDHKDSINRIKSYIIDSDESIQEKCTEKIINFLKGLRVGNNGLINSALGDMTTVGFLQSFFTDIAHHPNIIEHTKSFINEIYKDKKLTWLERSGVLISRFLEILTPEMSEEFNLHLGPNINGGTHIYSNGVFVDLINYVVDRIRIKELPQVDKLAFLKMLVHFVGFSVEENRKLPFTSEQLKTTLRLVKDILNEQRQLTLAVSESIEYLFILGRAGLKLIDAKKELLVLDPASEFQYKLSSGYMDQIIELIKWTNKNFSKPRKEFLKKCYEIVKLKKGNLKRKGSQSDLQELKRLKV